MPPLCPLFHLQGVRSPLLCSVLFRLESSKLRLNKYICVYTYTQMYTCTHAADAHDICYRHLRTLPEHPFAISPNTSELPFSIAEHCSKEMETSC